MRQRPKTSILRGMQMITTTRKQWQRLKKSPLKVLVYLNSSMLSIREPWHFNYKTLPWRTKKNMLAMSSSMRVWRLSLILLLPTSLRREVLGTLKTYPQKAQQSQSSSCLRHCHASQTHKAGRIPRQGIKHMQFPVCGDNSSMVYTETIDSVSNACLI